jgi:hypothetical protein
MKLADLDNVENVELKSPHQGFRTFLVIGPDNRPTVERISTAEPAAQPDGPPPAPVFNADTGKWELPA